MSWLGYTLLCVGLSGAAGFVVGALIGLFLDRD